MSTSTTQMVDVNVPRFNQTLVAILTAAAFLADVPWLVGITFLVLLVSWLGGPSVAPFTRLYVGVVRPRVQPQGPTEFEPAAPPRFAQMLGTIFLGAATWALYAGQDALGWGLALVVTALATLAAAARICVGCILYERTVRR
ncbi:MAG: DUF4395 domain-containing protein [Acidimicrobiia bacterium]